MKKKISYSESGLTVKRSFRLLAAGLLALAVSAFALSSCSDKIYKDINTDPTKADHVNPALQLSHSILQIYGDMDYTSTHRVYTYAFTQHLMGCWNTTNYGGQHRADDNEMARPWNNLYTGAIRNLTDGIEKSKDDSLLINTVAAMRIFRVYVGSLLTDYYGDVPYSEAGLGLIAGITQPKYDTQEEIYRSFFEELKEAAALLDNAGEPIKSDPLFNGDLDKWRTFANSLRLRYAMRLSDVLPDLAESEFKAAISDGVMSSIDEEACVNHMQTSYNFGSEAYKDFRGNTLSKHLYGNEPEENPTYICKTFWDELYNHKDPRITRLFGFYIDKYMELGTGNGRIDITDAILATDSMLQADGDTLRHVIYPIPTGLWWYDIWPSVNEITGSPLAAAWEKILAEHPDYKHSDEKPHWMSPKLANNFLRMDNPGVIMTYAEVCFLRAEAAEKGWDDNAATHYNNGIRAAMDMLKKYYDCKEITAEEYNDYIAQPGVAYGSEDPIKQINIQAWILHFLNPAEAWANVRRSDYPVLTAPETQHPFIDGKDIPVRLCYPLKESSYNNAEYQAAKSRVTDGYSWNARVWWDKK